MRLLNRNNLILLVSLFIGSLSFLLASCFSSKERILSAISRSASGPDISVINSKDISKLPQKTLILDIRTAKEYEISHIPNAILIDFESFQASSIAALIKKHNPETILVYCSVGYRSGLIAKRIAQDHDIKIYNLEGGLFLYAKKALPLSGRSIPLVHGYDRFWQILLDEELRYLPQ